MTDEKRELLDEWGLLNNLSGIERAWMNELRQIKQNKAVNGSKDFRMLIRKDKLEKSIKILIPLVNEQSKVVEQVIEKALGVEIPLFHTKDEKK